MKRLLPIVAVFLLAACNPDRCDTPFGQGGTIDITMPDFAPLSHVGGSMSVGGMGKMGVRITRTSYSDFVAFELACPTDHDACLEVDPEWGGSILRCPVCSSQFNALDGTPFSGAVSPCPLYQYNTVFDGQMLSVY